MPFTTSMSVTSKASASVNRGSFDPDQLVPALRARSARVPTIACHLVSNRQEPLGRVDLKLLDQALPLRRDPALFVAKFSRDLSVRFSSCKASQELSFAGTYVWHAVWNAGHCHLSESSAAIDRARVAPFR
jgi:hypothetical protein